MKLKQNHSKWLVKLKLLNPTLEYLEPRVFRTLICKHVEEFVKLLFRGKRKQKPSWSILQATNNLKIWNNIYLRVESQDVQLVRPMGSRESLSKAFPEAVWIAQFTVWWMEHSKSLLLFCKRVCQGAQYKQEGYFISDIILQKSSVGSHMSWKLL